MAQPPCSCLLRALVPHIFIIIVDSPWIWQCQHFASFLSKGSRSTGKRLNSDTIYPNFRLLWELGAVKLENGLLGWKELGWGEYVARLAVAGIEGADTLRVMSAPSSQWRWIQSRIGGAGHHHHRTNSCLEMSSLSFFKRTIHDFRCVGLRHMN